MKVVINQNPSITSVISNTGSNSDKPTNIVISPANVLTSTVKNNNTILVNTGATAAETLKELSDVDVSNIVDGALLIFSASSNTFIAMTDLEKQNINGGHF